MTNSELVKLWAEGKGDGKGVASVHVHGNVLLSYRTPIAKRLEPGVVLIALAYYSPSTTKHIGLVLQHTSGMRRVYTPEILCSHEEALRRLRSELDHLLGYVARAKEGTNKHKRALEDYEDMVAKAATYTDYYGGVI